MKKNLLLFIVMFIMASASYAQWTHFNTYFPWSLFAVDFVDDQLGYAVGEQGSVLKTTDGAISWEVVKSVPGVWFTSVYAYNSNIVAAVGSYGSIYITLDGGATWLDRSIPFAPSGYYNHFRDVTYDPYIDRYIVIGYAGAYYEVHTTLPYTMRTDIPWTMHSIALDYGYNDPLSSGYGKAYIAATDGRLYRTTNHGTSWLFVNIQMSMGIYDYLNSVVSFRENRAVIVGNNGRIIRTKNGGLSWTDISHGITSQHLRAVDAAPSGAPPYTLVAVGDNGVMLKSLNGGQVWSNETSGTTNHLYGVSLPTTDYGYAIGEVGNGTYATSLFTDNLSATSISGNSEIVPDAFKLSQNYPNPFNPVTKINFGLPSTEFVKLTVFDITGRVVDVLVNQSLDAGSYEFTFDATNLTSGMYFYRLDAGAFSETKKMMLIK